VLIEDTFSYLNHNQHKNPCFHQPVLVASRDVIADPVRRQGWIDNCWLQEQWASAITPKGFFFCEVAAAFDTVFNGPGGLPVEPGCWRRPLADFADQINRWCQRSGVCLPLPGRRDSEGRDDLTAGNAAELGRLGSPAIAAGRYVVFDPNDFRPDQPGWQPQRYLRPEP